MAKYKTATSNTVLHACDLAVKAILKDKGITKADRSAGFIMPEDFPKGEGYQVWVSIVKFSEKRLREKPMTGGLLA